MATIDARLRAMLVDGLLTAGAELNENALAQQMQVSRSALREAVRRLEQSALVTLIPNRGVFVRQLTLPEMLTGILRIVARRSFGLLHGAQTISLA